MTKRRISSSTEEYWFDDAAANRAVDFFEKCLTHGKGEWAGQPLILSPWQADEIIRPLFGWKRKDGTRKYRTAYIQIPRKAGKSTLAAGIANILLFADGEPGAEVYSAAADREQARIVFDMAKGMIEASEPLKKRASVYKQSIVVPSTASSYKVLSSDAYTKHGFNAHGIVIDEVHALPNRDLWDVLTTSTGARRQPLTVAITTAGYDRHSLCYELYDYAVKVRDGVIDDPAFLPVIYEAGKDDDWKLPATWRALISAEMLVGFGKGLGRGLAYAGETADMTGVMANILVIAILAPLIDQMILEKLKQRLLRYQYV